MRPVEPRLDLDDLPFLDPVGGTRAGRRSRRGAGRGCPADDRLVGPDALARVLHPLDDHAVERRRDRVLLEGLLGQLRARPCRASIFSSASIIIASATLTSASALLCSSFETKFGSRVDQPLVPGDDRQRQVLLGLGLPLAAPRSWRPASAFVDGQLGDLLVEVADRLALRRPACRPATPSSRSPPRGAPRRRTSRSSRPSRRRRRPGSRRRRSAGRRRRAWAIAATERAATRPAASAAAFRDGCMVETSEAGRVCREDGDRPRVEASGTAARWSAVRGPARRSDSVDGDQRQERPAEQDVS